MLKVSYEETRAKFFLSFVRLFGSFLLSKRLNESFQKCAVCSQQSIKSCSGCKNVYYCCYNHQKVDWKRHKDICAPYSVSIKDGRKVLILRKNVPPGAIIMDETPIFHVPESNGIRVNGVCVVCGLHMISSTVNRCSVCTWPVCGVDCESV